MLRSGLPLALVGSLALAVAGCAPQPTPPPTLSPQPVYSHAIEPDHVILREATGGGLVAAWAQDLATPRFSLYGDGRVIYHRTPPEAVASADGFIRGAPLFEARLAETEIQELLRFALEDGGLATAAPHYDLGSISDAPTTTFTIDAGGVTKTVSVYALGDGPEAVSERSARTPFLRLHAFITALIDRLEGTAYHPTRYRGILTETDASAGFDHARPWPWDDIAPSDFRLDLHGGVGHRTLTNLDVAVLGIEKVEGGIADIPLRFFCYPVGSEPGAPCGSTVYRLSLRPLLPDEDA